MIRMRELIFLIFRHVNERYFNPFVKWTQIPFAYSSNTASVRMFMMMMMMAKMSMAVIKSFHVICVKQRFA